MIIGLFEELAADLIGFSGNARRTAKHPEFSHLINLALPNPAVQIVNEKVATYRASVNEPLKQETPALSELRMKS
jgi:hypothetical protein